MTTLDALDIVGTFVFAVAGGFRATRHDLDLLGPTIQIWTAITVTSGLRFYAMFHDVDLPHARGSALNP
ncbi:MAG: hypothetical protein COV99_04645 [Bacteroidetes bacterium CG12_big_fil_rev_8_21_14_0_65_60_17]|nr:MAG: hypothetical protein COV99_04645 [Bacteroidetes bacterium CG12_big_fil_rev_8_21_14_0_65_60_17]